MAIIRSLFLLTFTLSLTTIMPAASQTIFLGTSTPKDGASRGIYAVQLDSATGALSEPVLAAEAANPGFLVLHPNVRVLYALGEIIPDGKPGGAVSAYALDPPSGRLTLLNQHPSD